MKRIYSATAVPGHIPEPRSETELNHDEAEIARYGKKQQLKVGFSNWFPYVHRTWAAYRSIHSAILVWYLL